MPTFRSCASGGRHTRGGDRDIRKIKGELKQNQGNSYKMRGF